MRARDPPLPSVSSPLALLAPGLAPVLTATMLNQASSASGCMSPSTSPSPVAQIRRKQPPPASTLAVEYARSKDLHLVSGHKARAPCLVKLFKALNREADEC